jgi:hypothetical protein
MKKITAFFIVGIVLSFVSCDTITHYTMKVSVDRNPTLTIENRTGHPVVVITPLSSDIGIGARTEFQPAETSGTINVAYRIGQVQFTEQVTMANQDAIVTLTRRPPTITVVNQTGQQVGIVSIVDPVRLNIAIGARTEFLAPVLDQTINIVYQIGRMRFTEQVALANQDVTVTLTRFPPTLTVENNTGETINTFRLRYSGSSSGTAWVGGNLVAADVDGRIQIREGGAQTGVTDVSIVNGDSMKLWLGDLAISGEGHITDYRYDVRIDDVNARSYVKSNVQILNDLTLTFTRSDRP